MLPHAWTCPLFQAHCHYFVVLVFANTLEEVEDEPAIQKVLTQLLQLYACHGIVTNAAEFLEVSSLKERMSMSKASDDEYRK